MRKIVSYGKEYIPLVSDNLPKHIKKGHRLVFSRQDLTVREADMFALMIAHMKKDDWEHDTPHYEFSTQQLSEWLGIATKHVGSNLSPVANRLASRKIGIKCESKRGKRNLIFVRCLNTYLTKVENSLWCLMICSNLSISNITMVLP